jgi:hypothetical protein
MADEYTQREAMLLDKLVDRAKADPQFTEEEAEALRQIIEAFRAWSYLGRMTRMGVVALGMLAAVIASWDTVLARAKSWLIGQ